MLHDHHRHAVRDRIVEMEVRKLELRQARARAMGASSRPVPAPPGPSRPPHGVLFQEPQRENTRA